MKAARLCLSHLTVASPDGRVLLRDVDLDVRPGAALGLVGPSGGGKTSLVRACLGWLPIRTGEIRIDDQPVRPGHPPTVGWVPQDATGALDPRLSAGHSIGEGLRLQGLSGRALQERVEELAHDVGLPVEALSRRPGALSGGQCQRACLARAISGAPGLLLADEPVSALDVTTGAQVLSLLASLHRRGGLTLILVAHSLAAVRWLCQEVAVLAEGRVVEVGPVDSVLSSPAHDVTKALLASELPL